MNLVDLVQSILKMAATTETNRNSLMITFPPPIPPKSKRLLEAYRQRNKRRYENMQIFHSTNFIQGNEKNETIIVPIVPVYDIVQFKTATKQSAINVSDPFNNNNKVSSDGLNPNNNIVDNNNDHNKEQPKLDLLNELELVLQEKMRQFRDGSSENNSLPNSSFSSQHNYKYGNKSNEEEETQQQQRYNLSSESKIECIENIESMEDTLEAEEVHRPINSVEIQTNRKNSDLAQEQLETKSEITSNASNSKKENEYMCPSVVILQTSDNESEHSLELAVPVELKVKTPSSECVDRPTLERASDNNSAAKNLCEESQNKNKDRIQVKPPAIIPRKNVPVQIKSKSKIVHQSDLNGVTCIEVDASAVKQVSTPNSIQSKFEAENRESLMEGLHAQPLLQLPSAAQPELKVHHVINLPPRKIQYIKKRRRKEIEDLAHQRSSRLSQHMIAEYKMTATDNRRPAHSHSLQYKNSQEHMSILNSERSDTLNSLGRIEACRTNMTSVGRDVKKRMKSWYQRHVKSPILGQLSNTNHAIENIKLPFTIKTRGRASFTKSSHTVVVNNGLELEHFEPVSTGQEIVAAQSEPCYSVSDRNNGLTTQGESDNYEKDFADDDDDFNDDEIDAKTDSPRIETFRAHETIHVS